MADRPSEEGSKNLALKILLCDWSARGAVYDSSTSERDSFVEPY